MTQLAYPGPHAAVDVPMFGIVAAPLGQLVDVPDDAVEVLTAMGWTPAQDTAPPAPVAPTTDAPTAPEGDETHEGTD